MSLDNVMEFEETPVKAIKTKKEKPTVKSTTKPTPRDEYKQAKATHKEAIKQMRADIKKHKLLIKQAKLTYKLSK